MSPYILAPHVADVRLSVTGGTQKELFSSALRGMAELIAGTRSLFPTDHAATVEVSCSDVTCLLIEFLSEVLTRAHIDKALYGMVEFLELTETYLCARVMGRSVDEFNCDVKAVTYHEADVVEKNGWYSTTIVFDI